MSSRAVLITGCSTGIGHAIALSSVRAGFPTWATARHPESLVELQAAGCHVLPLDVTDEEARANAVATVEAAHGAVGILVNNAGYALSGAVEELPLEAVKRQFDTNLFGLVRMCQLVLPRMREQRAGRIINVGSAAGLVATPGTSAYAMTKFALEALSDALRLEVRGFGIEVSIVEPETVRTAFVDNAVWVNSDAAYSSLHESLRTLNDRALREGARNVRTPEEVAEVVMKAMTAKRPKPRYKVGLLAHVVPFVRRVLPDRSWDALFARQLKMRW